MPSYLTAEWPCHHKVIVISSQSWSMPQFSSLVQSFKCRVTHIFSQLWQHLWPSDDRS